MAHALQSANNISQKAGLTLVRPFFVGVGSISAEIEVRARY